MCLFFVDMNSTTNVSTSPSTPRYLHATGTPSNGGWRTTALENGLILVKP